MDNDRKQILESCLKVIAGIADKEYQRRVWILGEGEKIDDFDETACNFFQDGNGIINHYKDFEVTDKQQHLLVKLRDAFEEFCEGPALKYCLPQEFLATPEWQNITEIAQETLQAFDHKTNISSPL